MKTFDFSKALKLLKEGRRVRRIVMFHVVKLKRMNMFTDIPDHFMLEIDDGLDELWVPTNADLFATDWYEVTN